MQCSLLKFIFSGSKIRVGLEHFQGYSCIIFFQYIYIYVFEAKKENLKKEHLRSIWIQLKLKTEKHCSKIIFKCVNSTVRPIFNEKVNEKSSLWDLWIVHGSTVHGRKVKKLWLGKEKKNLKRKHASGKHKTCFPNAPLEYFYNERYTRQKAWHNHVTKTINICFW